jgi:plastocyanin
MTAKRALSAAATIATALVTVPAVAASLPETPDSLGRSAEHADERVAVEDNFFSPRSLTLQRGESVQWVWKGENRHNVRFRKVPKGTSKKGSRTKRQGHWTRTFWRKGQYSYLCTVFAGMRGEITLDD